MKISRSILKRLIVTVMALLLICAFAVSCGGSTQATRTREKDIAHHDNDQNRITQETLNKIADAMLNNSEMYEGIVAAYRGYDIDIKDTGIDPNKTYEPQLLPKVDADGKPVYEVAVDEEGNPIANEDGTPKYVTEKDENGNDKLDGEGNPVYKQVMVSVDLAAAKKVIADHAPTITNISGLDENDIINIVEGLEYTVTFETQRGFMYGIGVVLNWITTYLGFGNYILGICVFAIFLEIILLPLAINRQKNSIRQANLRPKEMAIKNKYKGRNDQVTMQKMQQEIQEFYQRENFSPYSGCLPLLIQLPIIMALYYIVIDPLHYVLGQSSAMSSALSAFYNASRAAGGFGGNLGSSTGTIAMLSDIRAGGVEVLENLKDFLFFSNGTAVYESVSEITNSIPNFNIGPFNFGLIPSFERFDILLLVPVLTFVTYFLTSKLNRKLTYQPAASGADDRQVACSNTMMDVTMPLMSTFFTFAVPALVGVYWMFRSIIGMLKQFIIARVMPLPKFTEEDYKRAEKEMAGKRVVKKSENVGRVRSLHYIDDEDFEDTRERALARKAAIEEREREEQAAKAKKTPFGAAPIKEENKKNDKKADNEDSAKDN